MSRATKAQLVPEAVAREIGRPTAWHEGWVQPHRIALVAIAAPLILRAALTMR